MSELNQFALNTAEDHFLKTVLAEFDKNQALTKNQKERLESLDKEKSQLAPNKKSDYFSFKKSSPEKIRPRRPRTKAF